MKHLRWLAMAPVIAVVLSAASIADAAPAVNETDSNVEDLYYDFEVWMAPEVTVWIVKVVYNGDTHYFEFETYDEMEEFALWLWGQLGDDADIYLGHKKVPGAWEYVTKYDKRADAEQLAVGITGLGLYAKVVRVPGWRRLSEQTR